METVATCNGTCYNIRRMERFFDSATADIYEGHVSAAARRSLPPHLHSTAQRKLAMVLAAAQLADLRFPPGNELETLSGNHDGQHSIRINRQYRVCFVWTDQGATRIEVADYH